MSFYPTSYTVEHFHDDDGTLLAGGSLEFYIAGTTTPTPAYTDSGGTEAGTTITLNSRGEPAVSGNAVIIWLSSNVNYKIVLKDASGNTKTTPDNLTSGLTTDLVNTTIAASDFGQWPYVTVNATDTAHDIDFNAGRIADSSGVELLVLPSLMTKRLDAAWAAGNASGGLFSGTVANSTTYYCFLIEKDSDSSVDCGFDADSEAANIPSGYTKYRRIASFSTDGSANIDSTTITPLLNAEIAKRGQNNGTCPLNGSGLVPLSNLSQDIDQMAIDITGKLDASSISIYSKIPTTANGTLVWTGTATTVSEGSITGGLTAGTYIIRVTIGSDQYYPVLNVTQTGSSTHNSVVYTFASGRLHQVIQQLGGSGYEFVSQDINTATGSVASTYSMRQIWKLI